MNRFDSFKKACLESRMVDCSKVDSIAYEFFELSGYYREFENALSSLEDALVAADSDPAKCQEMAIAALALLQHWQHHARPAKRWLERLCSRFAEQGLELPLPPQRIL